MLIRSDNPFGEFLKGSSIYGELHIDGYFHIKNTLLEELKHRNHQWKRIDQNIVKLSIGHEYLDGFGAFHLFSELEFKAKTFSGTEQGKHFGTVGEFSYSQFFRKKTKLASSDVTFTQKFIRHLTDEFKENDDLKIGLVVALDDLGKITSETKWGNSAVIVGFSSRDLRSLSQITKTEWKECVTEKAQRVFGIMRRRGASFKEANLDFTISSLGPMERFSWMGEMDPSNLVLFATPPSARIACINLWSKSEVHGLSVIGDEQHACYQSRDRICQAWNRALGINT